MATDERKRVFILGAGFSKSVDMPDACGLTKLLVDTSLLSRPGESSSWLSDFRERIKVLDRHACGGTVSLQQDDPPAGINIEKFFDFATFDIMRLDLEQQRQTTSLGSVPDSWAYSIPRWLSHLERRLPRVLIKRQREIEAREVGGVDALRSFAESMTDGDTVLTFNYDTLLESALRKYEKTWSHGFDGEDPGEVTILKLHGSIDWLLVPRENQHGCKLLFEIKPGAVDYRHAVERPDRYAWNQNTVLVRAPDLAKAQELLACPNEPGDFGRPAYTFPEPGIAGLGAHKPLDRLVGSTHAWHRAFAALRDAEEIYVIGWSASPYDAFAMFHFASVLAYRTPRVVVVDPRVCKQLANYEAIFGDVECIGQCAQHVDWAGLLRDR